MTEPIDPRFYELVRHLWRGGSYAYYWTPADDDGHKMTWWFGTGNNPDQPEPLPVPKFFFDRDAYFGIHPTKRRRTEHERARVDDDDIAAVNCLFAEFDAGPGKPFADKGAILAYLAALPIPPSVIVDSGGGFHCYWYLDKPYTVDKGNRDEIRRYQMAWVAFVGGDDGAKDLARVLRIPGTLNRKPEYAPAFPPVRIVGWQPQLQHSIADLLPHIQPHLDALHTRPVAHASPPRGAVSQTDQELLDALFRSRNGDMYRALWNGDLSPAGGDHSKADMMLNNGLAWLTGRDILRMDSLFRQSGLMRDKWRDRDDYRDRTLQAAADSAQTVYDPHYVDPAAMAAAQSVIGMQASNGNGFNGNGAGHGGTGGTGGGTGGSGSQSQQGLTPAQQATIDLLFTAREWELLASVCAKLPLKYGRPYLHAKFLTLHGGDATLADASMEPFWFAGTPVSARIEADLVRWGYVFSENELDGTVFVNGEPIDDAMRAKISLCGRDNGYGGRGQIPLLAIPESVLVIARRNRFHPIRNWLNDLRWDGKPHLTSLVKHFTDRHARIVYSDGRTMTVFGAFLMRWMLGAIARAFGDTSAQNPVLVLTGAQGIGKSFLPRWLCSSVPDHFIEGPVDPENPDHRRLLVTRFIWEISELPATMNRSDANALKSFLTTGAATFRVPYAKDPITRPALASFFGTLNPTAGHLIDTTGNRRFLSVELMSIDQAYSSAVSVDQLWAEAMHYFQQGASYRLTPEEIQAQATLNTEARMTNDTAEALLKYYDIDPTERAWVTFTIDIVEHLRREGHRTDVTKVGTELRGMLGFGAEERRINGRKGKTFAGVRQKP